MKLFLEPFEVSKISLALTYVEFQLIMEMKESVNKGYTEEQLLKVQSSFEMWHKLHKKIETQFRDASTNTENADCDKDIRIEELETQLQQYKAYVADLTATINKNICKDFLPNIGI